MEWRQGVEHFGARIQREVVCVTGIKHRRPWSSSTSGRDCGRMEKRGETWEYERGDQGARLSTHRIENGGELWGSRRKAEGKRTCGFLSVDIGVRVRVGD